MCVRLPYLTTHAARHELGQRRMPAMAARCKPCRPHRKSHLTVPPIAGWTTWSIKLCWLRNRLHRRPLSSRDATRVPRLGWVLPVRAARLAGSWRVRWSVERSTAASLGCAFGRKPDEPASRVGPVRTQCVTGDLDTVGVSAASSFARADRGPADCGRRARLSLAPLGTLAPGPEMADASSRTHTLNTAKRMDDRERRSDTRQRT